MTQSVTYDNFGRLTGTATGGVLTQGITYHGNSGQVSGYSSSYGSTTDSYSYTYDNNGNILTVSDGTNTTSYVYDSANQLVRENNQAGGFTHVWTYDDAGNILTRTEYAYTTGELGTPTDTITYTYGDTDWGDLLTAYNGVARTYDTIGNLLTDGTWTYTWRNGRELATMSNGTQTWTYTYDANGMRTGRTNGTTVYSYIYNGGQLTQMTVGNNTLFFTYGLSGTPMTVAYNGVVYYYVTNLQGDVVALLDNSGNEVVEYTYDAWGNALSATGTMAATLGTINPLRYRGYVYDTETGLYYVSSRYYDPEIGRWINVDSVISGVGDEVLGHNVFAYCFNNPVNMWDPSGGWPKWIQKTVDWVDSNIIQPVGGFFEGIAEDWKNYNTGNESEDIVFSSNYFSSYKGTLVVKTPFDASFSFGIIGLSTQQQDVGSLRHEYGHAVQLENMGLGSYITDVAIPSITINLLERKGKLPYDYYSYPWEAEANRLGGTTLSQSRKPKLPQGGYTSFWDLIPLFFD